MKRTIILGAAGAILLVAAVAALELGHPATSSTKIKITASFYPVAEFARQIGGDKVEVTTMVKPGVEPHDYDPTPGDLAGLYKSKLFVYKGDLKANHVAAVDASDGITLRQLAPGGQDTGTDPHVWLDPLLATREVTNIENALAQADPANAAYYHDHAAAYKQQLAGLHEAYRAGLAQCGRHDIVTSHQAFGYLGGRYGLTVTAISGLSPDDEPTPQKLAAVAAYAKAHNVKYIFFETLVNPKLSQTIASEIGAQTLVFNPLEGLTGDEIAHGDNYLTIQRANLNNLRIALDCK
jgi:zinc transport system substrate-binding protein